MTEKRYPVYGETAALKPGLYLGLYHGFPVGQRPEEVNDWGDNGPAFGPLAFCHTTYACELKLEFLSATDAALYPFEQIYNSTHAILKISPDVVIFNGYEYGDWVCFIVEPNTSALPEPVYPITGEAIAGA